MDRPETIKGKITTQEIFYYLFFSLLFFAKGIGLYDGQNSFKIFLILAVLFFVAKMLITEYNLREVGIMAVLCCFAMIAYWNTREKGILFIFMTVIGLKNIPIRRLFKVALFVWCISYVPAVIATTLGWISSPFRVHVRPLTGFIIRWGLGSAHPNVGHIAYLIFTVLVVYVMDKRVSWKTCIALFAGNCFVFLYTVSQTGFLMTTFYLAATVYLMCRKKPSRLEYGLVQCVLPLCIVASLILPVVLKGRAFEFLNKLLNTRIMQSKRYLTEEEITLFGKGMGLNDAVNTMDNSYLFAFMTYGVIIFAVIMFAYFVIIRRFVKLEKKNELAIIVTLLIAGFSEPFLFNTSFKNVSLLFLGELIFTSVTVKSMFWDKRICIFRAGNRDITVNRDKMNHIRQDLKDCVRKYSRVLLMGAAVTGILWSAGYSLTSEKPVQIIVPRSVCDSTDAPSLYIPESETEGKEILGYVDEKTPMVAFEGILPQAEYVRGIVCRVFYGAVLGFVVVLLGCYMVQYSGSKKIRSALHEKH